VCEGNNNDARGETPAAFPSRLSPGGPVYGPLDLRAAVPADYLPLSIAAWYVSTRKRRRGR
jgi:hypothetical protein